MPQGPPLEKPRAGGHGARFRARPKEVTFSPAPAPPSVDLVPPKRETCGLWQRAPYPAADPLAQGRIPWNRSLKALPSLKRRRRQVRRRVTGAP
ncbi:hypothetical protein HMPREF1129_2072 [Actinomyces naeslundii str. Howell 279]|uniref:Uncharacterized protein n=1 Tax=Actinomyces naeslundii (strain ATCC 12104 / DSM 43013 / CCUG 2238 / JCM 8349 / NCTC 10301 / Howell 279) TaxID=1115803 RepID=J3AA85_ACTNH|nr:hypothetical protein HMPREF1129_2072 [Actinomyces naeslundii str. Howell 279]